MKAKKTGKPRGTGKKLTEARRRAIARLRAKDSERWTFCALAARFGCTDGTAFRVVRAAAGK